MKNALFQLRPATNTFPELRSIPLYVRFNRARDGDLKSGDEAPDVALVTLDNKETSLLSLNQSLDVPLVVCAGSIT